jgi:hypothetical protein
MFTYVIDAASTWNPRNQQWNAHKHPRVKLTMLVRVLKGRVKATQKTV